MKVVSILIKEYGWLTIDDNKVKLLDTAIAATKKGETERWLEAKKNHAKMLDVSSYRKPETQSHPVDCSIDYIYL